MLGYLPSIFSPYSNSLITCYNFNDFIIGEIVTLPQFLRLVLFPFLAWLHLIVSTHAFDFGCGSYEFKGTVKIKDNKMNLFINEGTQSEIVFHLKTSDELNLAPYLNHLVVGKVNLLKRMDGNLATQFKIISHERGTANPLAPLDHSYFKNLTTTKCE